MFTETGTVDEFKRSLFEIWIWRPPCGHRLESPGDILSTYVDIYGPNACPICERSKRREKQAEEEIARAMEMAKVVVAHDRRNRNTGTT